MNYFNSIEGRKVVNPNLRKLPFRQVKDLNESDWTQIFTELGFVFRKEKPDVAKVYQHKHDKELTLVLWLRHTTDHTYNVTIARGVSKDTLEKVGIKGSNDENVAITLNNLLSKIRGLYETNN